ncbi:polysaccharide biosynthesis protein [Phormidium sp. CCY1219]|uniref:polysaccharide biosynthesis protein n=1 Tax=Phormidium sp. CCY1219 TaxID=2886104 RepID=UPI002D1F8E8F|nr:nucleoside-diphosphate sugar epimerase/dehydratase [Phormidium sp. CCY1219]MEB3827280.1 polysaccharide biosynthesis protein [Phormidium sp. CCY1219]
MIQHWPIEKLATAIQTTAASLSRPQKRLMLITIDIGLFIIAIGGAFGLRFSHPLPLEKIQPYIWLIPILILTKPLVFLATGMYRPLLRYAGVEFLATAAKAVLFSSGAFVLLAYLLEFLQLPRSILVNDALLTLLLVVSVRLSLRWFVNTIICLTRQTQAPERLVIYGAGAAGSQLAQALAHHPAYKPIAFVDDDPSVQNQNLQGLPVYAPRELPKLQAHKPFDTVLMAMPSVERIQKRQILDRLHAWSIPVKTIPCIGELLSGKLSISEIRNIDIVDLLGREEVAPDPELLQMNITGKSVLVTGAGGSIGSELCRQIAQQQPKCLVLYELGEFALYNIDLELGETYPHLQRVACLGSVTDEKRLSSVIANYQVETIYHAAAYKHVPLVESNPAPGILNNILGTWMAARCAIAGSVANFVLISTDKAVRPTNIMGASKRVAELLIQALAEQRTTSTCFTIVRFGNVLDSSGSVVPRFRKQIAEGQPITVTHPDMTRYFMSIPEAARLVIQASSMGKGGEIFLLDMGEPVRIYDLAIQMIQLSGLVPGQDIEIKITGLRPGEKLHEELLVDSTNARATQHPKIFCAREAKIQWEFLQPRLETLLETAGDDDAAGICTQLQQLIPEYQPQKGSLQKYPRLKPLFNQKEPKAISSGNLNRLGKKDSPGVSPRYEVRTSSTEG